MKKPAWKDTAELIGIAAIVASLIFVGVQLRQEQRIAVGEIGQTSSVVRSDLDYAIAEHSELFVKSNSGSELTEAERATLASVVAVFWRTTIIEYWERSRLGDDDPQFVVNVFAVFLFRNPGARTIWLEESGIEQQLMDFLGTGNVAPIRDIVVDTLATLDTYKGVD